jgi:hypothetical protein
MSTDTTDRTVLRSLAERYAAIAHLDVQGERIERYRRTNDLQQPRPVVLIDEVPWGEIVDESLALACRHEETRRLEERLRRALYQWEHWQVDTVIAPVFRVTKRAGSTGIGVEIREDTIPSGTGSYASSHRYADQLDSDEDLARLEVPVVHVDHVGTERAVEIARDAFEGLLPVEVAGTVFGWSIWDSIAQLRGVDHLLMDLAVRPEFMHRTAHRFAEIGAAVLRQYRELDLLDASPLLIHCTPACTRALPAADHDGSVRPADVWGRCSAQIFSAVSPAMHDEFDLACNQELFAPFGLLYYGCCEPLHLKIDILRRRFANLRKISITPWADPDVAARSIGRDFVLAAKPNPAFVSGPCFDPQPVEQEISRYLEACRRHGTTCEFVLKDISTISGDPGILTRWAETVAGVIDRYC